ncbi:MAG: hypothetical protein Ct9H300mP1_30640 [Planctomycetaceae bacterium]|nr:MAG: hypothetical protein Ct9H300mP1_30640 [Planctomycetaceae bacterium]
MTISRPGHLAVQLLLIAIVAATDLFAATRPNIVFIFTDDHAAHALSVTDRRSTRPRNLIAWPRKACSSATVFAPIRSAVPAGP